MSYAWLITKDLIDEGEAEGTMGPRGCGLTVEEIKAHPMVEEWRCYDDDGNLYYQGLVVLGEHGTGFEPLDDFCSPNAGCTEIRYKNPNTGEWGVL